MFRAFRNKVFAIYFFSILILLVGALTFVYVKSYNEMENSIEQRLNDDKGPKDEGQKPIAPEQEPDSEMEANFNVDEAKDLTIYQNEDLEQKLTDYLGDTYVINYQDQIITSGDETYVFKNINGVYKIVKVTYDLQYIASLKQTLIMLGIVIIIIFSLIGFVMISKLVEPIEESYKVQNRFVSDASHELKTPLAIMKSCLQLIAKGDDDSENLIGYCQDETDRLIRLTSNLLQLSENDKLDYEPINVSQTLEILISGIEVGLFEKKIKLETEIVPNIRAKIASDDLNQLTHILIDNAVKYNDERKNVKIRLAVHNRHLILTVSNSSDLVNEESLEHLFDRFYRVDNARMEKGFGLGLALAKHITNKYHGVIKAEYNSGYFTINVKIPQN